jgi:hypothetical protein
LAFSSTAAMAASPGLTLHRRMGPFGFFPFGLAGGLAVLLLLAGFVLLIVWLIRALVRPSLRSRSFPDALRRVRSPRMSSRTRATCLGKPPIHEAGNPRHHRGSVACLWRRIGHRHRHSRLSHGGDLRFPNPRADSGPPPAAGPRVPGARIQTAGLPTGPPARPRRRLLEGLSRSGLRIARSNCHVG